MKNMQNKKTILKRILYAFLALIVLTLGYFFLYEPNYDGLIQKQDKVLVFAHRGFGNHAPDNSLVGAKLAMQNNMDGVDVDAQLTVDSQIVIFHDLSLDRLTTSTGKVTEKTLVEMESIDLGEKYGHDFDGARVATFEKFVEEITPSGTLMVEFKVSTSKSTGMEEKAAKIIEKYNAYEKVYISSFNPVVLYRLKKIDPRIRTVLIFMDTNWNPELLAEIRKEDVVNYPWFLRQEIIRRTIRKIIKPDALSVNNEVNEKVMDKLIKKGYPIFLWTIDEKSRLEWALEKKPYGIISDEPMITKQLRDGKE
jgi:glycerophosphoryl diester phosphodiesterase